MWLLASPPAPPLRTPQGTLPIWNAVELTAEPWFWRATEQGTRSISNNFAMPLTPANLAAEKTKFLNKPAFGLTTPQQAGWQEIAFRDAMTSASRRARLYRKGLAQRQRDNVRVGWQAQLALLVTGYVANGSQCATQQQFFVDVGALQQFMNANYASFFHTATTATAGYAPGFRIAHAQKSLSLVLKHFWCNGVLSEPPCCPVDRSVLVCALCVNLE